MANTKWHPAMKGSKSRPIYSPSSLIKTGLYTAGSKFMVMKRDTDDKTGKVKSLVPEEYVGLYHTYPNGAVYTGGEFNEESEMLVPYSSTIKPAIRQDAAATERATDQTEPEQGAVYTLNNSVYFRLTGKRFHKYRNPEYYYPTLTPDDYKVGRIRRYFIQRTNTPTDISEVSSEEYSKSNTSAFISFLCKVSL